VAPLFDRRQARVGERVRIDVGYAPRPREILLYLIPLRLAPKYVSASGPPPTDPHLFPLYSPRLVPGDPSGAAQLFFRVPRVPLGRYTIVVWCKSCGNRHWAAATPTFIHARAILRVTR